MPERSLHHHGPYPFEARSEEDQEGSFRLIAEVDVVHSNALVIITAVIGWVLRCVVHLVLSTDQIPAGGEQADEEVASAEELPQKTGGPGGQISSSQQDISKLRDEKQQLNNQCATLEAKIVKATEKERVNEEHITRLQSTIERMLKESNERMKTHLNERKALSEERCGCDEVDVMRWM
ncbi:hypothetical protein EMCRGX_G002865 [Ephydatia muelleri]